jgi:hypothetical protein
MTLPGSLEHGGCRSAVVVDICDPLHQRLLVVAKLIPVLSEVSGKPRELLPMALQLPRNRLDASISLAGAFSPGQRLNPRAKLGQLVPQDEDELLEGRGRALESPIGVGGVVRLLPFSFLASIEPLLLCCTWLFCTGLFSTVALIFVVQWHLPARSGLGFDHLL